MRLSVDVGGTFIDFVYHDEKSGAVKTEKVRSAGDLSARIVEGIEALGVPISEIITIVHGSTMVLNSIVQDRGARVGLITTKGFRDVLELGRGSRVEIYNLFYKPPPPLVPRFLRFEICERVNYLGEVIVPIDISDVLEKAENIIREGAESISICFINSYVNPIHEQAAAEAIRKAFPEIPVSISSDIVRERREFERTNTTVINSFTQPKFSGYLEKLEKNIISAGYTGALTVMQSTGGITSTGMAKLVPVRAVQSGPAGGVIGAHRLSKSLKEPNIVVADLGGTTFDVSLIAQGQYFERSDLIINGRPIMQPSIDIVSIGAGGGSIVSLDKEGGLRVGPESAQADPGPICYGFGGSQVTLTDALLCLGYFDTDTYMGGRIKLNVQAAREAIEMQVARPLGLAPTEASSGILHLATLSMADAIRKITIERGFDPREFAMLAIGGGSGLFAGALLDELQFKSVIVPNNPAVFSAWGLLNADYREDKALSFLKLLDEDSLESLNAAWKGLEQDAISALLATGSAPSRVERFCEMRYVGQAHTVRVAVDINDLSMGNIGLQAIRHRFEEAYARAYSHVLEGAPLEITTLRIAAIGETVKPALASKKSTSEEISSKVGLRKIGFGPKGEFINFDVYDRASLAVGSLINGPAIVEEWNCTVTINPGQHAHVDELGNIVLEKIK